MTPVEPDLAIPVYACSRGDLDDNPNEKPIGTAESAAHAASMINSFLSERDGADYGLKGRDIYFSRHMNAYFTEE